jgi:DNA-binding protein HU-beta
VQPAAEGRRPVFAGGAGQIQMERRSLYMAKAMTKSEIAASLAEKVGISKKQVNQFFEAQAELAYKQAKNTFVLPGIGKLKLVDRPARKMVMRFGPDAGKEKMIPKSKKVKFAIAKAAKDAILGAKK